MKKVSALALTAFTYLTFSLPAFAQTAVDPCPNASNGGGVGFGKLCGLTFDGGAVGTLITIAFVVAALIALAFLIFGGIKWIISGGDSKQVEGARNMIVAALVGLVIVFLAFFIINFIFTFFNLGSIRNLKFPKFTAGQ